jgi:hypothetical protein
MGLCTPFTTCAVCAEPLGESGNVIGFPDLVPMFSEFGDFYDGCAHLECMKLWPRRDELVQYFNTLVTSSSLGDGWRLVVLPDGNVSYQREAHVRSK